MKRLKFLSKLTLVGGLFWAIPGCPPQNNGNNDDGNDGRFDTPTRSSTIALTSDDRFAVVVNRETDSVAILEVRDANKNDTANLLAELAVGDEPRNVALLPDDSTAFVTNTASGTVSVIALDAENGFSVTDDIAVGTEPRGCAVTPNGTRLYVANHTNKTVSVINTDTLAVIATINLPGFPQAIAITNDGDGDDNDETVYVTEFFAETIEGGRGEAFDDGKEAFVDAFTVGNPGSLTRITLSPLANSGFTANRNIFCKQLNAAAAFDTFCPDTTIIDATNNIIDEDVQAVFPNQLHAALIRGTRLFLPSIGAQPEPPIRFNVNVQALVHVVNTANNTQNANEHLNLNNQIKLETQPSVAQETSVLTRLFSADTVAVDADAEGKNFLFVSRGGNFVMKAQLGNDGLLTLNAPNIVRFQTGNLPNGVVINSEGTRAYVNNEVNVSVSALNLQSNTVITRDIPTGTPPTPGTFDHAVLVGKLAFFSALGVPDNEIFDKPVRNINPLLSRNKMSDNSWSSCASCHPDGLADGVTWIFATGPRQTLPLDAFFAKDHPIDQRISNWNAVRGSVTDFNENSVAVQGGKGFAGDPINPGVYNHGLNSGVSDALDAQTLWVQTVRAPILPDGDNAASIAAGRDLFETNCASCHGGPKWTKSQIVWADNPGFIANPLAGGAPRDIGVDNAGNGQVRSYTSNGQTITFIEPVGTFSNQSPIEIRNNATLAAGGIGFNVPGLLGIAYHAPYFHDGSAKTLQEVLNRHTIGGVTISTLLNATQQAQLIDFLETIDGATIPFRSATDDFRDAVGG